MEISSSMLSKLCSAIANKYGIKVGKVNKLIPNLRDKIKYIVHYKNLQYYLSLGMKLIKIHRILKFKQSNWLKEYIEFNTEKRKQSADEMSFKDRKLFDYSGYPIDSKYYDSTNKKVLGKMKDKFNEVKIVEFVGLKSKMYSLISIDDKEVSKAKVINKKNKT